MRYKFLVFIVALVSFNYCNSQQLYSIPKQTIDPFKILGPTSTEFGYKNAKAPISMKLDMDAFEISSLVTFGEYKEYLAVIKKDSSSAFYLSQMPDTTMCTKGVYKAYTSGNDFDSDPVVGISWEAAMNYCRWKTMQNNKGDINYIFRLPCESEWLDACNYLNTKSEKNDLSQNYSDWLLNTYDEDAFGHIKTTDTNHWSYFDYIYFADKKGPHVLQRKSVIGDSYLFKLANLADYMEFFYYEYQGYRQVGFRVVKENVDTTNVVDSDGKQKPSIDLQILKYWGLK